MEIDREAARRERREAKERAREEARQERQEEQNSALSQQQKDRLEGTDAMDQQTKSDKSSSGGGGGGGRPRREKVKVGWCVERDNVAPFSLFGFLVCIIIISFWVAFYRGQF